MKIMTVTAEQKTNLVALLSQLDGNVGLTRAAFSILDKVETESKEIEFSEAEMLFLKEAMAAKRRFSKDAYAWVDGIVFEDAKEKVAKKK